MARPTIASLTALVAERDVTILDQGKQLDALRLRVSIAERNNAPVTTPVVDKLGRKWVRSMFEGRPCMRLISVATKPAVGRPLSAAHAAARDEAMRTGRCVKVSA